MILKARSQSSAIKSLIYPEKKVERKNYQFQNKQGIKKIQEENKTKKEEKENNLQRMYLH
jgi:hypothetical protein